MASTELKPEPSEPSTSGLQVSGRQRASRPARSNTRQVTNLLLVEDNTEDANLLRHGLGKIPASQVEVTHATHLTHALDMLSARDFDLVFLDLTLPDSMGLETLHAINAAAPNVPVVVLNGLENEPLIIAALQSGAQDYLVKDKATPPLLERSVRYAIGRKRVEDTLREIEERYRQMFERNQAVKLLIDPETRAILDANPAAARFYGYSLDDLKRMNITDINTLPPEEVEAEMTNALAEQRTYFNFPHKLASGEIRDVEVHSSPLDIGGRRLLYSIVHDITERKQAEREVHKLTADLEHRVAERTAQLEAINWELEAEIAERKQTEEERNRLLDQLKEAVRTREELLSIVSHDLKNPLGVIKGFSQLMRRRIERAGSIEPQSVIDTLGKIDTATNKMRKLIDDLLDFARLQADQPLNLNLRPVDLVGLTRRAVTEAQQATSLHRIYLNLKVPHLVGRWDEDRLEQVLSNLLSNAVKYSPDGKDVTVTVWREDGEKAETGEGQSKGEDNRNSWAVVSVKDQGIGIPAADLPHIFDWYHRASNVSEQVSGTGIGLASARQILKQHGGTITVSSREAEGSIFTVRLPL